MEDNKQVYPYRRAAKLTADLPGKSQKTGRRKPNQQRVDLRAVISRIKEPETYLFAALAFILSRALVLGEIFPFGSAFFAAVSVTCQKQVIPALAGLCLGAWFLKEQVSFGALFLIALGLFALLRLVPDSGKAHWAVPPLLVAVLQIAVRLVFLWFQQQLILYDIVAVVLEGLIAGVLTLVFIIALDVVRKRDNSVTEKTAPEEVVCLVLLGVSVVLGLAEVNVFGINVDSVVSKLGILVAAIFGGIGAGAAIGAVAGMIPCLAGYVTPSMIGFLALSGLLAGAFRGFGKPGAISGFLLGNLMLSFYFLEVADLYQMLAESLLACALFLLVPAGKGKQLRLRGREQNPSRDERMKRLTLDHFEEAARGFRELALTFNQLSAAVTMPREQEMATLLNTIACRVCRNCPVFEACWERDFFRTYKAIVDLLALVEMKGAAEHQLSGQLGDRCVRADQMLSVVDHIIETRKLNCYWGNRVAETGELLSAQLEGVARIVDRLAGVTQEGINLDHQAEAAIKAEIQGLGLPVAEVTAVRSAEGQYEIRLKLPDGTGLEDCRDALVSVVSGVIEQPLVAENGGSDSEGRELILTPAWPYRLEVGIAAKARRVVSGDTCASFKLKGGKQMLVLSDGMGFGPRAARESKATVDLLEKLMASGFDKDVAIRTVNHFLALKSMEAFSTLDLALVDLNSGLTDFVKVGAAPSFLRQQNRVEVIKSSSLPLGVLDSLEIDCEQRRLTPGDILVMVSDGVLEEGVDQQNLWLASELEANLCDDVQLTAENLLEIARERGSAEHRDDMTVLVARFTYRQAGDDDREKVGLDLSIKAKRPTVAVAPLE